MREYDVSEGKMTQIEHVQVLLRYLEILNIGKSRPDKTGGGTVRDALMYIPTIEGVVNKLNEILQIDVEEEAADKDPTWVHRSRPRSTPRSNY